MVDRKGTKMCGIAGKISRNPFPTQIVEEMGRFLSHRGPDDSGLYAETLGSQDVHYGNNLRIEPNHSTHAAFYHKRLSIIDQSDRARQPACRLVGVYGLALTARFTMPGYLEAI